MKKLGSVILVVGAIVSAVAPAGEALSRQGFSGGPLGHHFDGHHRFDGHRSFLHNHVRIFVVAPLFFSAPILAAPVFVGRPPIVVAPPAYWYYCRSYRAYYPYVTGCPEPWVSVPAQ